MLTAKVLVVAPVVLPTEPTALETVSVLAKAAETVALRMHHLPAWPAATLVLPVAGVVLAVGIPVALLELRAPELVVDSAGVWLMPAATDHGIWATLMDKVLARVVAAAAATSMVRVAVRVVGPDQAAVESIKLYLFWSGHSSRSPAFACVSSFLYPALSFLWVNSSCCLASIKN
jgi:hypothetical protein